jgi:hypothetical protein
METINKILFLLYLGISISGCKKDSVQPGGSSLTISNLQYDPSVVTIKQVKTTFFMNGTITFTNASGGVAKLRLTTSTGADLTVLIQSNTESGGTLSGLFEITIPQTAGSHTFQVWIIDNKGNPSNKLQGNVQAVIDDSGTTWSVISQTWPVYRVIWLNQNFIGFVDGGKMITSADGLNWTTRSLGTNTNNITGMAWSGSQYIAVGTLNTILSSPDGISWTSRLSGTGSIWFSSVASSDAGFVAVGQDLGNSQTAIFNSTDGITWTPNLFTVAGGHINNILWAGNQYVAVGQAYGTPLILTSANGLSWENRSSSVNTGMGIELNDVTWTGRSYVTVGFGLTASSPDGISWTMNDHINWGPGGVVWSGNRLMASAMDGFYSSTDGLNWTKTADSNYPLRSITWSGIEYVSAGFIMPVIMVSPSQSF